MACICRTYLLTASPEEHARALEEAFVATLWEAGTLGIEHAGQIDGRQRLRAYFPLRTPPAHCPAGAELAGEEVVLDTDWLALYRERARPFPVGRTFWVDPREPAGEPIPAPPGRSRLQVPARAAFGTGSHESTALAIELLERIDLAGARVLDMGTGTGILALAALERGAASAVGFDLDPAAPFHARENARANGWLDGRRAGRRLQLFAGRLAALASSASFDLALVNIVPEQVLPELPEVAWRLAPAGSAILSGILVERGAEVLAATGALGLVEVARLVSGEWIAFQVTAQSKAEARASGQFRVGASSSSISIRRP
jgi:ribosomal protein L11 methyltransferase